MFRRFFAILYFHQHDHPELRALKQHLRHIDVAMTRTYVTDSSARPLAERIRKKLGRDRLSVAADSARSSLAGGFDDLQAAVVAVGREKFRATIESILTGRFGSGGFSRIVRSMYRKMAVSVQFSDTELLEKIATRLEHGKYSLHVMQHGQCHAPERARSLRGRCDQDGAPARDQASPVLCNSCPFHFSDDNYLANVREQLVEMEADIASDRLSGMLKARTQRDIDNLRILVNKLEAQGASSVAKQMSPEL
jgi:hypothetical protein